MGGVRLWVYFGYDMSNNNSFFGTSPFNERLRTSRTSSCDTHFKWKSLFLRSGPSRIDIGAHEPTINGRKESFLSVVSSEVVEMAGRAA